MKHLNPQVLIKCYSCVIKMISLSFFSLTPHFHIYHVLFILQTVKKCCQRFELAAPEGFFFFFFYVCRRKIGIFPNKNRKCWSGVAEGLFTIHLLLSFFSTNTGFIFLSRWVLCLIELLLSEDFSVEFSPLHLQTSIVVFYFVHRLSDPTCSPLGFSTII